MYNTTSEMVSCDSFSQPCKLVLWRMYTYHTICDNTLWHWHPVVDKLSIFVAHVEKERMEGQTSIPSTQPRPSDWESSAPIPSHYLRQSLFPLYPYVLCSFFTWVTKILYCTLLHHLEWPHMLAIRTLLYFPLCCICAGTVNPYGTVGLLWLFTSYPST